MTKASTLATEDDLKNSVVSLRVIAEKAGVSISTVSRVLSGSKSGAKIRDETRRRILEVCERLHYYPNINYRRLHEGRSRVIAFLVPAHTSYLPFFDENVGTFLSALEPRLAELGFDIMFQSATQEFLDQKKHVRMLRDGSVDGVIWWNASLDDEVLHEVAAERCPVINVAFWNPIFKDQLVPDNFYGAYDLTQHLLDSGHKNIAYISGGRDRTDKDREAGHRKAMAGAGLGVILCDGEYTFESGYEWAETVTRKYPNVTAIFAANDLVAAGCLRRLKQLGKRVPDDIAVAGFDGTGYAKITEPPLTTVSLQMEHIGTVAATRMVNAITNPKTYKPENELIRLPVIVRESTRKEPAGD